MVIKSFWRYTHIDHAFKIRIIHTKPMSPLIGYLIKYVGGNVEKNHCNGNRNPQNGIHLSDLRLRKTTQKVEYNEQTYFMVLHQLLPYSDNRLHPVYARTL